jgi:hypothetical protein
MKAVRVGSILLVEIAAIDAFYDAVTPTNGSPLYAVAMLAIIVIAGGFVARSTGYWIAAVLTVVAFCVAMVVAISLWGT